MNKSRSSPWASLLEVAVDDEGRDEERETSCCSFRSSSMLDSVVVVFPHPSSSSSTWLPLQPSPLSSPLSLLEANNNDRLEQEFHMRRRGTKTAGAAVVIAFLFCCTSFVCAGTAKA